MIYSEGPFRQWQAIQFPAGVKMAGLRQRSTASTVSGLLTVPDNTTIANLLRVQRGKSSEFEIHWENVPKLQDGYDLEVFFGDASNPYNFGPYYNHLTGALLGFNDRPFIGLRDRANATMAASDTYPLFGWEVQDGAPFAWTYCPAYDRMYSRLIWTAGTEPVGDGETVDVFVTLRDANESAGATSAVLYERSYVVGTGTLEATLELLKDDLNASGRANVTRIGTELRIESASAAQPIQITFSGWFVPVSGWGEDFEQPDFDGVETSAAPAHGFEFNGIQNVFDVITPVVTNFEQAEGITFVDPE